MMGSELRIIGYAIQKALNHATLYGCIGTFDQHTYHNVCHLYMHFAEQYAYFTYLWSYN